jgi:signal transduction histidine kinase
MSDLCPITGSLSARLLLLTVLFVMLSEVLIFVPSVARYRYNYLEDRINAAHLAIFALEATPDNMVSPQLADRLLAHVGAHGIVVHRPNNTTLMLDSEKPPHVDATYDLRKDGTLTLIRNAMMALAHRGNRVLRVLAVSQKDPGLVIEVLLDEAPMRREMWAFGIRVLELSIIISLLTAALLYVSLRWLLVTPLKRLTASMIAFRDDPEDAGRVIVPERRSDEIGLAQRELATMQETVRQSLRQKERLAALGTAVTKISHDLRNILSTARLMSDSLAGSAAPEVRRVAPTLLAAIDRAVALCSRTLTFTREEAPPLRRSRFALAGLVEELAEPQREIGEEAGHLDNDVPPSLILEADRDQLFRVLQNLVRNAVEAGARSVTVTAWVEDGSAVIEVMDDGPGLPPKARENLFRAFAGSARPGGTGLGLAIVREVLRAHGGDIQLRDSSGAGTVFALRLPAATDVGPRRSPSEATAAPDRRVVAANRAPGSAP